MARSPSKLGSDPKPRMATRRKGRLRSPLENVGVALTAGEKVNYATWRKRATALGESPNRVLRFALWYPALLERWTALARERDVWGSDNRWDDKRDDYCRREADYMAHHVAAGGLTVHLVVEEADAELRLAARYCRTAPPAFPAPRWTDDQRLTWEQMTSGEVCRGCGRGFWGAPEWKPILQRSPEEEVAFAIEEAAFKALHPDCPTMRWSFAGGGLTHCSMCCPPPPFGPDQGKRIAKLLVEIAIGAASRDADLEQRWKMGPSAD
jgi:hypothetical protein